MCQHACVTTLQGKFLEGLTSSPLRDADPLLSISPSLSLITPILPKSICKYCMSCLAMAILCYTILCDGQGNSIMVLLLAAVSTCTC